MDIRETIKQLVSPDSNVRELTLQDFLSSDHPNKVEILKRLEPREPNLKIRYKITKAIQQLTQPKTNQNTEPSNEIDTRVKLALESPDPEVQRKGCLFLIKNGQTKFIPFLESLIQKQPSNKLFGLTLLQLLSLIGPHAAERIIRFLKHDDQDIQIKAIEALGNIQSSSALVALIQIARGNSSHKNLANSLLRDKPINMISYLKEALVKRNNDVDQELAKWLSDNFDLPKPVKDFGNLDFLQMQLDILKKSDDPRQIASVISILATLEGDIDKRMEVVTSYSRHDDDRIRANSVEALGVMLPGAKISQLSSYLNDKSSRVVANAAFAISSRNEITDDLMEEVVAALHKLVRLENRSSRAALYCIGANPKPEFLPIMVELAKEDDPFIKSTLNEITQNWKEESIQLSEVKAILSGNFDDSSPAEAQDTIQGESTIHAEADSRKDKSKESEPQSSTTGNQSIRELKPQIFHPSGKIAPMGYILTPLLAFLGGWIPAFIYGLICSKFIFYLNLIVAGAVSMCSIVGLGLGIKMGKVRNLNFATAAGIIAGSGTVLGAWMGFGVGIGLGFAVFNPLVLANLYSAAVTKGQWSTMGASVCHLFYILEAAALFFPALLIGRSSICPYCEECQQFPTDQSPIAVGYCPEPGRAKLFVLSLDPNLTKLFAMRDPNHWGLFTFSVCNSCNNFYVLKIENVIKKKDDKGNDVEVKSPVVSDLIMDRKHSGILKKLIMNRT